MSFPWFDSPSKKALFNLNTAAAIYIEEKRVKIVYPGEHPVVVIEEAAEVERFKKGLSTTVQRATI